jgi:hypothetical protein
MRAAISWFWSAMKARKLRALRGFCHESWPYPGCVALDMRQVYV